MSILLSYRSLLVPIVVLVVLTSCSHAQETLAIPADSSRWELQEKAKVAEYQGRKCLLLDGGAALVKDFSMRDAVIDVDVATPAARGFFGIQFRVSDDGANGEWSIFANISLASLMRCNTPRF